MRDIDSAPIKALSSFPWKMKAAQGQLSLNDRSMV